MPENQLFAAINDLALASHAFSDVDISQPFFWRKHGEGVRLALIGTHQELQDLAAFPLFEETVQICGSWGMTC